MAEEVGEPRRCEEYESCVVVFTHRQLFERLARDQGLAWDSDWRLRTFRFTPDSPMSDQTMIRVTFDRTDRV